MTSDERKTSTYRNSAFLGTGKSISPPSTVFLDTHSSAKHPFPPTYFCVILLQSFFLWGCAQLITLCFLLLQLLLCLLLAPALHHFWAKRQTLTPDMKRLRDLYKWTSSYWHSSAIPNTRCNYLTCGWNYTRSNSGYLVFNKLHRAALRFHKNWVMLGKIH